MRPLLATSALALCLANPASAAPGPFRAGAAVVDASPQKLPVIVNGGFLEAKADRVRDPVSVRALVLDDGATRVAIAVVDSCMMPRDLIDKAKGMASEQTGIPADRMLVSATHTHSAPSAMGCLGSRADAAYVASLPGRIAEAIARANGRRAPAEVGWAVVEDAEHTHCRRWIRRPDRMLRDPFGDLTVRANMHPGHLSPDVIGPSGPTDPAISVLAVRAPGGRPIAVLANYSMHYFGADPVSADYYGRFASRLGPLIGGDAEFVGIMSQGTSGDQQWMDYGRARDPITIDAYAEAIARRAAEAYRSIAFRVTADLAMAEARPTLGRRTPDARRLEWARKVVAAMGDRLPKDQPEVYAKEAIHLHDEPRRELILQAIRVGDFGIAAIPDEVYALSGLKIKARSPLVPTAVIELANGSEGYIPPPEQHFLGGYTTWPARTAALEVEAEPKIVESVVGLLERVSGRPRRSPREPDGPYAEAVKASKPVAYFRLDEMDGREAIDAIVAVRRGYLQGGYALYLDGPPGLSGAGRVNHAVHLAGGHLRIDPSRLGGRYSIEFWFWNGLPQFDKALPLVGLDADRLSLASRGGKPSELFFHSDEVNGPILGGGGEGGYRRWRHAVLARDGHLVRLFLDGKGGVLRGRAGEKPAAPPAEIRIGSAEGAEATFEGKIDEVAIYDRVLPEEEIATHLRAAGQTVTRAGR